VTGQAFLFDPAQRKLFVSDCNESWQDESFILPW
jgi:hypothetical protein